MTDKPTNEKIKLLHPKVRQEVQKAVDYINAKVLGKGVRVRLTSTYRTFKEQDAMFAQGRTKPGKIITKARAGFSFHNYGLAFDICLLLDKNGDSIFEEASWDTLKDFDHDGTVDWAEVVAHLKSIGWKWGGDFKSFPDCPHFEKTFGYSETDLLNKHNKDDDFTEVIDGKTYNWVNL